MKRSFKKSIFFILALFTVLFFSNFVLAADDTILYGPKIIDAPDLQIKIPGMESLQPVSITPCGNNKEMCYVIPWIAQYIGGLYKFGVSVLAILSVMIIAWGGIVWLTAGGSAGQVTKAKDWILGGITGLILGLTSFVILITVNPDLVNLKPIKIAAVKKEEFKEMDESKIFADAFSMDCYGQGGAPGGLVNQNDQSGANNSCNFSCINKEGIKRVFLSSDGWKFCCICNKRGNLVLASGIDKQFFRGDASTPLIDFINCMGGQVNGTITSISDSNGGPSCYISHPSWQQCSASGQDSCCYHTKNSCHYGGNCAGGKSYAIDVVGDYAKLKSAAVNCAVKVGQQPKCYQESSHLHISVGSNCGCDEGMSVCR